MLKHKITIESLKADYPEVYASAKQEIETQMTAQVTAANLQVTELTTKLTAVSSENTKLKSDVAIRTNAAKLNLPLYGEELITAGTSVEEALSLLIGKLSTSGPETNVLGNVLKQTASKVAGQASTGDVVAPTTYEQAKAAVKVLQPGLKGAALAKEVRRAYPELMANLNEVKEN